MTQHNNDPHVTEPNAENERSLQNTLGQDDSKDQAVIEALQHYLRQRALTQSVHLPRWASW